MYSAAPETTSIDYQQPINTTKGVPRRSKKIALMMMMTIVSFMSEGADNKTEQPKSALEYE